MNAGLTNVSLKNYRSLADISVDLSGVNVIFGPNGAGKSTFLDGIWFFRDCAIRGVALASTDRNHGIGLLYDGADEGAQISVGLSTAKDTYEVQVGFSEGRIEPFAGERLFSRTRQLALIDRVVGTSKASLYHSSLGHHVDASLREPQKLSMGLYLDFNQGDSEAAEFDRLLHVVHFHNCRSLNLTRLKRLGSEIGHETWLKYNGLNAFSVLRNVHDKRSSDSRFDTIMAYMRESFPTFETIVPDQTGPETVYCEFVEQGRRSNIKASGVSDGHLQMLLLLTALFSEAQSRDSLILLDEPEISLHPWALSVLATAINAAATDWNRQVLIATHSPALISQFEPEQILAAEVSAGRTHLKRVSDIQGIQDLLEQYATGTLYMAQVVGAQAPRDTDEGT